MRRFALAFLVPAALLLALVVAPLAGGGRTLFLRDTLLTHLSMREGLAAPLRAGEIPLVDPLRAGGQALAGNLNAVALYPDNLLLLFTSSLWQLNAHFWLHWIAAFAAAFWLARALGWSREAAAATGAAYAFSGYFLSQLNLYNGIAPAALAPALAAAAIEMALGGAYLRRGTVGFALLWALSLYGGDPIVAGLALLAALALAARSVRAPRAAAARGGAVQRIVLALVLGTALAAPQILTTRDLLAESSRGFRGFEAKDMAIASPGPAALIELVMPLYFGRPDSGAHWGNAYFGGTPPLYFSLAPGAVALALAALALARGGRERVLPATLAFGGAALTFSSGTALSTLLAAIPGMSLVRFQAKFALLFALGTALLAGLGAERLQAADRETGAPSEERERAGRSFRRALTCLFVLFAAIVFFLALQPGALFAEWAARFAQGLSGEALAAEAKRWAGVALLSACGVGLVRLAALRLFARRSIALPVAIAVQVALQLLLLRGIYPTEPTDSLEAPAPALAGLSPSTRLVHGAVNQLFGNGLMDAPGADPRLGAQVRRAWQSGFTVAAHAQGLRTELDSSPEGLDPFTLIATEDAVKSLPDAGRIRLLRATGVDRLLLPRQLVGVPESEARLERVVDSLAPPLSIYAIEGGWGDAVVASCVRSAPHMNAALARLLADDFDPRREAVIPGSGPPSCPETPLPTAARIARDTREEVEVEVEAPAGGVLVLARAYLPIWRAEIDGRAAKPVPAQMSRLAVVLPAGASRVRLFVDRSPLRLGAALALAAALTLALLASQARTDMRRSAP